MSRVNVTVAATPKLALSTTSLGLAAGVDTQTVVLRNTGRGFVQWSAATSGTWLKVLPASGYIMTGDSAIVKVVPNRDPLPAGTEWSAYEPALQDALRAVRAFAPDAVVVSLGVDTALEDADTFRLGGTTSSSFDVSQIGAAAQYQGFGAFAKIAGSSDRSSDA